MSIVTSSSFAKALWPGVNKWYGEAYAEYPVEWTSIFPVEKSGKAYEEDVGVSNLGLAVVKPEGSTIHYDGGKQGFTTRYTHVTYALGFIVTREAYEDDQYMIVGKKKAKGLAFSIRQTKEIIAANILNRAFNSSYVGGDGLEMCSTAHVNVAGGTWSNELTTAADLSEASLEQAAIDIANFTDDRGLQIAVRPQKLIIPVDLMFEAERILQTSGRVGTDLNDINALKQMGYFPKGIVVNHYLTDSDAWFVQTDCPDGLKCFERWGDRFDTDNDWDTWNAKFQASFRASWGWTDPRGIFGSPGA